MSYTSEVSGGGSSYVREWYGSQEKAPRAPDESAPLAPVKSLTAVSSTPVANSLTNRRVLILSSGPGGGHRCAASAIQSVLTTAGAVARCYHFTFADSRAESKLDVRVAETTAFDQLVDLFQPEFLISTAYHIKPLLFAAIETRNLPGAFCYLDMWHGQRCVEDDQGPKWLASMQNPRLQHWYPYEPEPGTLGISKRLGIPVRPAFKPGPSDPADVHNPSRSQGPHVTQVLLTAGGQPETEAVLVAVKDFLQSDLTEIGRVHLTVLCAHNSQLRAQLGQLQPSSWTSFTALPQQSEEEVAAWVRASDLVISKPGGVTVGEILQMGKQAVFLAPLNNGPEPNNGIRLEAMGFLVQRPVDYVRLRSLLAVIRQLDLTSMNEETFAKYIFFEHLGALDPTWLQDSDAASRRKSAGVLLGKLTSVPQLQDDEWVMDVLKRNFGQPKDVSIVEAVKHHFRETKSTVAPGKIAEREQAKARYGYLPGWESRLVSYVLEGLKA